MKSIIEYCETELAGFDEKPLGEVDSLVLSQAAYWKLDAFVGQRTPELRELLRLEIFDTLLGRLGEPAKNRGLLYGMAANPRFRKVRAAYHVDDFDAEEEKQFSATTWIIDDEHAYIAFRGTDSTLVGWKEDLNMSFMSPVPSQTQAGEYLIRAARATGGRRLFVGGHSKGGNLAVYAAMKADEETNARIEAVFSHDGPGFRPEVLAGEDFARISGRIRKTVPESSLIGMLLQTQEEYKVVRSNRFWIMQHDPFSWEVDDNGFLTVEDISRGAQSLSSTINSWLNSASDGQRRAFVGALYDLLLSMNADSGGELIRKSAIPRALSAYRGLDDETREALSKTLSAFADVALSRITPAPLRRHRGRQSE